MPERKYRPGSKKPQFRPGGRMSENRYAWLRTIVGQFIIMHYPENEEHVMGGDVDENEYGPTVRLMIPRQFGQPMKFNFTAMTLEELQMTKKFFDLLFELAEPVVRDRDRIANEALENGDDSFARIYRQVPQLVIRGRPLGTHNQGVHDGPSDAPAGQPADGDTSPEPGAGGVDVADDDKEGSLAQDDDAPSDEHPSLWEMGRVGESPTGLQGTGTGEE